MQPNGRALPAGDANESGIPLLQDLSTLDVSLFGTSGYIRKKALSCRLLVHAVVGRRGQAVHSCYANLSASRSNANLAS